MTRHKAALGKLFDIGSSKRVLQSQWRNEGVPFYRGREITKLASDGFVDNELFISEDLYREYAEKYGVPKCDDIMITAIGTIGNSYIVKEGDRFYFKDASVLWLKKVADVSSDFINFWLKSPVFFDQLDRGNGATVDTLTIQKLKSVIVDLPSLPEQQRIVGILDEAFDGIATAKANAEKNLQNARALFESHLQAVFSQRGEGWVEKPLSAFAQSVSTGPFGSLLHKSDYVSDGVPLVNPINIVNGSIVPDANKMIDPVTKQRLQSYVLQQGDIVVGRRGEIGRCAVVEAEQAGWVCGTGCFFIRPLQSVNPYFLANLIRSSNYREQLERASSGATMLNLSNKALGELPVAIPNLLVQNHMLAQLEQLSEETQRLESIYQQKLSALDALKKSVLDQAFKGEL